MIYPKLIAQTTHIAEQSVVRTIELLDGGSTIPFISRYRKEMTGGLDEVQIGDIKQLYDKLQEIARRKETILHAIEEQEKLTPELQARISDTWDATALEDLYLPFKPKRQTKAEIARRRGLEPLADLLMSRQAVRIEQQARQYITDEVQGVDDALQGARDIVAERVNEDEKARNIVRGYFRRQAVISTKVIKGKEAEASKYRDYFEFSEPLARCTSHRLLAMRRGESEGFLRVNISPDDEACLDAVERQFTKTGAPEAVPHLKLAVHDAYKRLLKPAIETEFATSSKEKADEQAIHVFAENLRQLLLAAPLGQKRVLAIDPGFRTGCKVVCLDEQGNLLHNETIFPHPPIGESAKAGRAIVRLVESYRIEAIGIGNGTAGRETEQFITALRFDRTVQVFSVSEDGASIYSASKIARDEFPEHDVTVRGAVSIGRRLMDPLAELVKIDAKSIGVGQYQHDVNQTQLKNALDRTVESCVNLVGVNLNTASMHLLTYISGLGPSLAKNIVDYRTANGAFHSRKDLLKVPRLGAKAFEQAAGFLRIPNADNPLDNSAVHPESYHIVERMAEDLHCTVGQLIQQADLKQQISLEKYVTPQVGMPTLLDIRAELDKPGRDPRQSIRVFEFDPNVRTMDDLREGQELPGIISNITNFGCFVDLGIKEKGLIHISNLADRFVSDPASIVSIHQHVRVSVLAIDKERKRIQLKLIAG